MNVTSGATLACTHCPAGSLRRFTKRGLAIHFTRKHRPRPLLSQPAPQRPQLGDPPSLDAASLPEAPPTTIRLERLGDYRMSVRVLKHIPKGARNLAAGKLSAIIEKCLQSNSSDDWFSLLTFAYSAFRVPDSKNGNESLTTRVKKNIEGNLGSGSDYLPSDTPQRHPSIYKLIETKVYDGDLRGAVRLLTSDCSLAIADPNTLSGLLEKHPTPLRPTVASQEPEVSAERLTVSAKDVADAIGSFHASSAAGLDGLRPQHLKELVAISAGDNGPRLLDSLTNLCNFLLEGRLCSDVCPFLYGASLCALRKRDGGIRPIAVGSVLRRLVAKLGCRAVREQMADQLRPHQLGFGTPLGCEAAIHATRVFAMDPERAGDVILKLDIKNAFNSLERDVMLAEARDKIPLLCPFLSQCYVSPSNLYFNGQRIASQVGAQQGDPLGPLLFSLAINNLIASLKAPLNVWYLDDGTIGGAPDIVAKDLGVLVPRLRDMGLIVNSGKCELYPCGDTARGCIADFQKILPDLKILDRHSFALLGAPVFEDAVPASLLNKREMLAQVRQHLRELPAHVALTLFRSCLSVPKLMYVMRTSPTWLFPQQVSQLDEDIKDTLELILNVHLDEAQWLQASLPIRHGGLGVRRVQDTNVSAFLASSNGVVGLVTKILHSYGDSLDIPHMGEALTAWTAACSTASLPKNPGVQRQWDEQLCRSRVAELLEAASGADIARLKAALCPESGAWLHALPSPHLGTALDDGSLRVAVALRLGCNVCEKHECRCGAQMDDAGYHGLSCRKSAGRFPRHHMLNEVIRRALVAAGIPSTLEPPGLSRTDGKRPDGLTLTPWEKGRCLVWDATCVSTFAASHLARTTRAAGSAAEWAAVQKRDKYSSLEGPYLFVPFAVEVSGTWCVEAKSFVRELGRRLKNNGADPRAESYLVQRISLAIQRGNVASVMGTFASGTTRGGLFD